MEKEIFLKSYPPLMMRIIERFVELESIRIKGIIDNGNHHQINRLKDEILDFSQAKMLLQEYPGCPYCFEFECTSDHK